MLAGIAGTDLHIVAVPRRRLELDHLIPDCSPFSGAWMSALENRRSKRELGMTYTSLATYLPQLVKFFSSETSVPPGYNRRALELQIAREAGASVPPLIPGL